MKNAFALLIVALLPTLGLPGKALADSNSPADASSTAGTETNLFPEGSCEILNPDGLPQGFIFPDKNDKPWLGGNTASVVEEDGKHFVRLVSTEAFPYFNKIHIPLPVPDGAKEVIVRGRFRAHFTRSATEAPWYGYHVHIDFGTEPAENGEFADSAKLADQMIINVDDPTDWVNKEGSFAVPSGAKFMVLQIMVNGFVGNFDFGDIQIIAK